LFKPLKSPIVKFYVSSEDLSSPDPASQFVYALEPLTFIKPSMKNPSLQIREDPVPHIITDYVAVTDRFKYRSDYYSNAHPDEVGGAEPRGAMNQGAGQMSPEGNGAAAIRGQKRLTAKRRERYGGARR